MSSISIRRPEFRLYLSYPDIILTSGTRTLGRVATTAAALRSELGRLLEPVRRARGRLVAVLPESEVWRGHLDLAGDSRAARRASARSAVADRIAAAPDDVAVVLGRRDADGFFPVAGVRRSSLRETRTLLAAFGLRPAAIVGGGLFPGFSAAPRLAGWSLALPRPALPLPPLALPRLRLPDLRLPALSLPALSLPPMPALASLPLPRHRLGAIAGAGAVVSLAVAVLGLPNPDTPRPAATPEAATLAEAAFPAIELPPVAEIVLPAPPLALAYAAPPKPRPAEARAEPLVTVAARNMPKDLPVVIAPPRPTRAARLAELSSDLAAAPARALDGITAPLRRPAPAAKPEPKPEPKVEEIARTAMPALPAPAATSDLRPVPRPVTAAARPAPAAAPATATATAALAPRPRAAAAGSAEPAMLVASLDPAPLVQERLAAATAGAALAAPPPARPASVAARPAPAPAKVAAKVAARPAPVVVRPQPVPVRQVAVVPAAKVVAPAPVRQKVVAKPAPVRQAAAVKKVPVRQAATQVRQAAPQPVAAVAPVLAARPAKQKPAAERVGLSRRDISLVGVFGGADGRHALVRLPNGNIERVKAGDRVHGVQVAAISADSVRLTGRGRDTVLRLPD